MGMLDNAKKHPVNNAHGVLLQYNRPARGELPQPCFGRGPRGSSCKARLMFGAMQARGGLVEVATRDVCRGAAEAVKSGCGANEGKVNFPKTRLRAVGLANDFHKSSVMLGVILKAL